MLSHRLANVQIKQFEVAAGAVLKRTETLTSVQHVLNDSTDAELPVVDSHGEPDSHQLNDSISL